MSSKRIPIVVSILMIVFSLIIYPFLPEQVAVHWSIQGVPDTFAHKSIAVLLIPSLMLALLLIGRLSMILTASQKHDAEASKTYAFMVNAIVLFLGFTHVAMLLMPLVPGQAILRLFVMGLGVLFAALGNVMGRLRPNLMFGFRFFWTLDDEEVWRHTHRMGGRWLFVSGLVIAVAALIFPLNTVFLLLMVLLVGGGLALAYLSHDLWSQRHSGTP
ncbi:MAG: SdpI family protein [Anaerolineaceae bacterium]|nr:SdpI family protein [Anaerolineaceae bacterium]